MLPQRRAPQALEAADSDVILNLAIPYRCVVLHEPAPESRQFPHGKAFNCRASLVNTAHEIRVYLPLGYSGGAERYDDCRSMVSRPARRFYAYTDATFGPHSRHTRRRL